MCDIPYTVGPGLQFFHIGSFIHIGKNCQIGKNFSFPGGVVLGKGKEQVTTSFKMFGGFVKVTRMCVPLNTIEIIIHHYAEKN